MRTFALMFIVLLAAGTAVFARTIALNNSQGRGDTTVSSNQEWNGTNNGMGSQGSTSGSADMSGSDSGTTGRNGAGGYGGVDTGSSGTGTGSSGTGTGSSGAGDGGGR